jgi:plasmid stabilization system protein ParE
MSEARIDILRYARSEIDEALSWYLDRSVRAAEGFLREIDRGLALIAQSPELWPTFESGTRRYVLRRYPYSIIFRETPKGLEVVAVAHHKRRPTYWVGR